jgi:ribose 1,5-bisphosphokinase
VTRTGRNDQGELSISPNAFEHYRLNGHFALYWQAHGLHYGVSVVIDQHLQTGRTVVVNGSRANLDTALSRYPQMTVVHITVPPTLARERLTARGREDTAAIAARLQRAPALNVPPAQLVNIDNSGPLDHAIAAFANVLIGEHSTGQFPRLAHWGRLGLSRFAGIL